MFICPLCGDWEMNANYVGGVCLACSDAITMAHNERRASIIVDPNWREVPCCYSLHEFEQRCPRQNSCMLCGRPWTDDQTGHFHSSPVHGFTCGWCDWGRDRPRTLTEYTDHVDATGHEGDKETPLYYPIDMGIVER